MKDKKSWYYGHRYPPEIISYPFWFYHRFCHSFRDVEDLLAERGAKVSYESVRQWCNRFEPQYARTLKRRQGRLGDTWHLDEVFIKIRGKQHHLWRAVKSPPTWPAGGCWTARLVKRFESRAYKIEKWPDIVPAGCL